MMILHSWLKNHKFQVHTLAFGMMILTPALMFIAARVQAIIWIWIFLALFSLGNLLALSVP